MTEEIIVNGVNVAECEFYFQDEKYSCDLSFINQEELCKCDDIQDCTYKQLKRLEQENKELRKANEISIEKVTVTAEAKRLQELEQENKELKEMYRLSCLKCEYKNTKADVDKYRSALEEIRELVKADCKGCTAECDCDEDCTRYKIKNKINECLGE